MSSKTLIIFTRFPIPGKTKTRLIPALGEEGAAKLQREMTEMIVKTARRFRETSDVDIEIHYADGNEDNLRDWLGNDLTYKEQSAGDIGRKMDESLQTTINEGAEKAVLIGTDCPAISIEILQSAFDTLSKNDVVLGPAKDGGYYLVGLKKSCPDIFQDIEWGNNEVLAKTVEKLVGLNLSFSLLKKLDDIDRPEDVILFYNECNRHIRT